MVFAKQRWIIRKIVDVSSISVQRDYPDGVFCWVDLATPDPDAAKTFYTGLFGWEADDRPIDVGGTYTPASRRQPGHFMKPYLVGPMRPMKMGM